MGADVLQAPEEYQMKEPTGLFGHQPARFVSLTKILHASQSHPFQAVKSI